MSSSACVPPEKSTKSWWPEFGDTYQVNRRCGRRGNVHDLAWFDETTRRFQTAKVSSNRGDESRGFLEGLGKFGALADLGAIVHGTTVGTNALLERKGARIGIITTKGFRDVLEMRRRDRPNTWGLWGDFVPVATRQFRLEVDEPWPTGRSILRSSLRTSLLPRARFSIAGRRP